MKQFKKIILGSCVALLALLSAKAASACPDAYTTYTSDGAGAYSCGLVGTTNSTCTYSCHCYGNCTQLYKQWIGGLKQT